MCGNLENKLKEHDSENYEIAKERPRQIRHVKQVERAIIRTG